MTKDHNVEHLFEDLSCNDINAQQQIVLIDIKRAAKGDIHCVKKPLSQDLNYVAISYRAGEVDKTTIIDTKLGYLASITFFDVNDFYQLCATMTKEPDFTSIDYVWVNAICLDDPRSVTIHHMLTSIYEHAHSILVVPDLHSAYLNKSVVGTVIMDQIRQHQQYIYHLMHGNTDQRQACDDTFLDTIGVPGDPALRQWLTTHADSGEHHDLIIDFSASHPDQESQQDIKGWQQAMCQRNNHIRQSMDFLTDLMMDWSSRVWAIHEYHISKKKKNLRWWFTLLAPPRQEDDEAISFFNYDCLDPKIGARKALATHRHPQDPVHQLHNQSFLEMMLKSKASINDHRFYAIFPLFPEYKHLLSNSQNEDRVASWHITTLVSVRLKLYEIMTTKDKWRLLYLSSMTPAYDLPTFATSSIPWWEAKAPFKKEEVPIHIMLHKTITTHGGGDPLYYLHLTPIHSYYHSSKVGSWAQEKAPFFHRIGLPMDDTFDLACITGDDNCFIGGGDCIYLIGSFKKNMWILLEIQAMEGLRYDWDLRCSDDDDFDGFHVY